MDLSDIPEIDLTASGLKGHLQKRKEPKMSLKCI